MRHLEYACVFIAAASAAFVVMTAVFWLACRFGGHSRTEMMFGGFASYVLSLVFAAQMTWLAIIERSRR